MENKNWREQFEKLTPDNSSAGYEKQKEWLKNNLHLFTEDMYDEPAYTLDKDKIESFIESLLKSKQEEIEHQIYLKRNVFGLGGGSDTEEQDKKNAENVIRMNAYNQALDDLKPIISNILLK